jgi:large subunit ribosomal protein L23
MAFNLFHTSKKPKKEPKASQEVPVEGVSSAPVAPALGGSVLKRYFVSEKSTRGFSMNQYTFEVERSATKTDVRDAVERGYRVDVIAVNIIRLPKKSVSLGRHKGTRGGIKKAIVTVKEGQSIAQAQP